MFSLLLNLNLSLYLYSLPLRITTILIKCPLFEKEDIRSRPNTLNIRLPISFPAALLIPRFAV